LNIPYSLRFLYKITDNISLTSFGDIGRVKLTKSYKNLLDFGVGFNISKIIFGTEYFLRVDLPFWLNQPPSGKEQFDFRYVISFSKSF
jgi:hypothetical protein